MSGPNETEIFQRVLGRVKRQDFVGRTEELTRIRLQAELVNTGRGLLLLMEPAAGVSELLRQAYDELFNERTDVVPIYYAFTRNETTAVSAAIEFLNTFLHQYIAHRRNDPALSNSTLTLRDLVELAPHADVAWIEQLIQSYDRVRFSNDNRELVRFCLSVPQRIPARLGRPFVMLDGVQLTEYLNEGVVLGPELLRVFSRSEQSFVIAGLRRQVLDAVHKAECDFDRLDTLRLETLNEQDASSLVEYLARRHQVPTSREARELMVQQFEGSPLFISSFVQAARDSNTALISYLDCERLYVDQLLGGHLQHYFNGLLHEIAPQSDTRVLLIKLLWESIASDEKNVPFETWRKRLHLSSEEVSHLLHRLHVQELVNWASASVDATTGSPTWRDYLKTQYRLDVLGQPRALVVADALSDALKRAPQTMARYYKQAANLGLRELVFQFDCQRVPAILFDSVQFAEKYKGALSDEVGEGLGKESDLLRLPQVIHVATCKSFNHEMNQVCVEDKCVVVHAFEDGAYNDSREVVWLVAEVDSKLEVELEVAKLWFERLDSMARVLGFRRYQVWLISNEGFDSEAAEFLQKRAAYFSGRRQLELLAAEIGQTSSSTAERLDAPDEFVMVVPMGEDNELIAANTVEHIARRLTFEPAAINQIKTAIVEACINASEHSYSPDRKIYQRFRVDDDRLVVTISSRGIVPTNVGSGNANTNPVEDVEGREERRGWGLKLIRTLMDEVEFEKVDDGTSLKMTKYLRHSS